MSSFLNPVSVLSRLRRVEGSHDAVAITGGDRGNGMVRRRRQPERDDLVVVKGNEMRRCLGRIPRKEEEVSSCVWHRIARKGVDHAVRFFARTGRIAMDSNALI